MKKGLVYLVGAGPGDPELISLKALRALEEAHCIIYDYLADKSFVQGRDCEIIYVGKEGSSHTLTQDEINTLIVQKALEGKTVVRLKGGDPFIFGRGGEEAEELEARGIPFVIIPGVSSFYSAPAYAGIPLTHRNFANAFEVVSGHRRADADEDDDVNFPEYNPEKTFVFLMGMKNLKYISRKLIEDKNFDPQTPVGIISWGTRPEQRVITAPLSQIADEVEKAKMKPPAIIIMGGVVTLRDKLRWFDNQPLFGKKIVVTRTREQASRLSKMLTILGARTIELPVISIKKSSDMSPLHEALKNISRYSWLVFTSQNAISIFFEELFLTGRDARSLGDIKIAAIGRATADELHKYGLRADLVPPEFVAESLLKEMQKQDLKGSKILLPCAADARHVLTQGLKDSGADVERIHIYTALPPESADQGTIDQVKNADIITFTSSSTAKNFFSIIESTDAELASIGPVTSETLRGLGHTPHIEAEEFTVEGLVESIIARCSKGTN